MRKIAIIFSLFMFFILNMGVFSFAQTPHSQLFEQGLYELKDLNLLPNIKYNVHNESNTETLYLAIFDKDKKINESIRIKPNERITILNPLNMVLRL